GLALPTATTTLPLPTTAPGPNRFVGIDFDTDAATGPVRMKELFLDGQLSAPISCGAVGPFNVALWDITDDTAPSPFRAFSFTTPTRNRRTLFTTGAVPAPRRHYRLVAAVTQYRPTTIAGPVTQGPITIQGGLNFDDADPCPGANLMGASVDPTKV